MFEGKYSKTLTIVLVVVIGAIIVLLGILAFNYIKDTKDSRQASDFVEDYQGNITTAEDNNEENDVGNVELDPSAENIIQTSASSTGKKKYKGYDVLGTMKIPSIKLSQPILEQNSAGALNAGLILLYPKDNLNKPGNSVIQGHNYRNGKFFSNLKKVSNGDKVYVTDYTGKSLTYEIYSIFEASSTDTSFYNRDTNGLAELTLSTCTDASNDVRTIVFARQVQ